MEHLYGAVEIERIENVQNFINKWKNDEDDQIPEKVVGKIWNFFNIIPQARLDEYTKRRTDFFIDNSDLYLSKQRKMFLIQWPYDSMPVGDRTEKSAANYSRFNKYLSRLPSEIVDFDDKKTLPMQVYPLRYLAYWQFQKNIQNLNQNCLCNFNFSLVYSTYEEEEDNYDGASSSSPPKEKKIKIDE